MIKLFAMLVGLVMTSQAYAIDVQSIGAQWRPLESGRSPGKLVESCFDSNGGGWSCIYFPSGALIYSIQYQSSVKDGPHEVLFRLVASADGYTEIETQGARILISTHHISKTGPTTQTSNMTFPKPFEVPAGWYLWYRLRGTTNSNHQMPFEVQTSIYGEWASQPIVIKP